MKLKEKYYFLLITQCITLKSDIILLNSVYKVVVVATDTPPRKWGRRTFFWRRKGSGGKETEAGWSQGHPQGGGTPGVKEEEQKIPHNVGELCRCHLLVQTRTQLTAGTWVEAEDLRLRSRDDEEVRRNQKQPSHPAGEKHLVGTQEDPGTHLEETE